MYWSMVDGLLRGVRYSIHAHFLFDFLCLDFKFDGLESVIPCKGHAVHLL